MTVCSKCGKMRTESDDDITWITVNGNHIPIGKGEDKQDAIDNFFKSKGIIRYTNIGKIKTPNDIISDFKSDGVIPYTTQYDKQIATNIINDVNNYKNNNKINGDTLNKIVNHYAYTSKVDRKQYDRIRKILNDFT